MAKKTAVLLPKTQKILEQMGEQIKYARLRRKLSMELVAERAGIKPCYIMGNRERNSVCIYRYVRCSPTCTK